jgi:hypothetical protein
MDHEEYLRRVKSYIKTPTKDMEQQLQDFCSICTYVSGQYDKDESFVELRKHLEDKEKDQKESNRIFYMALPPSVFTTVSQHLKKNCYPKSGLARIIVRLDSPIELLGTLIKSVTGRKAIRKGSCQFPRIAEGIGAKLEGGGDLPYRPLLGEGNGQEHFDPAIW